MYTFADQPLLRIIHRPFLLCLFIATSTSSFVLECRWQARGLTMQKETEAAEVATPSCRARNADGRDPS